MHFIDEVTKFCAPADLQIHTENLVAVLERYINELELFNSAYDLVGAISREEIRTRHILDSLAAVPVLAGIFSGLRQNGSCLEVADVGSGAGLPGIPLAAVFPEVRFTLVERMSKRCAFLESCAAVLGLKNVRVLQSEAEKAPKSAFDVAVFRAFRPLDAAILKTLFRLVRSGGVLAAYKAKTDKIRNEMASLAELAGEWRLQPLDASFLGRGNEEHERNLVVIPVR